MAKVIYFDWVRARRGCTPVRLLQRLQNEAAATVETANTILGDEGAGAPFALKPLSPAQAAGFAVTRDRPDGETDTVTFSLRLSHIQVAGYRVRGPLLLSAELDYERPGSGVVYALEDADGPIAQCRESWQVLAWILGPILFSELREAQR